MDEHIAVVAVQILVSIFFILSIGSPIYEDAHKSQASDWNFLSKQLFGSNAPDSSSWKDINKIVDILNVIGRTPAYNHMLFHDKGGLDFSHAEFAAETGCIGRLWHINTYR